MMVNGAAVAVLFNDPLTYSCTIVTPVSSLALNVTLIWPLTVAPFAGLVIAMVGGVVSKMLLNVTWISAFVVLPAASAALSP